MKLSNEEVAVLLAGIQSIAVGDDGELADIFDKNVPTEQLRASVDKLERDCENDVDLKTFLKRLYTKVETEFVPYE